MSIYDCAKAREACSAKLEKSVDLQENHQRRPVFITNPQCFFFPVSFHFLLLQGFRKASKTTDVTFF